MPEYADLEIDLDRGEADSYTVEFRYNSPDSESDIRTNPALARFDAEALRAKALDMAGYGLLLTQNLFADPALKNAFDTALASAQTLAEPLRVRLYIGPEVPELHSFYWETLRDQQHNAPLFMGQNVAFSRYLSSMDWRPVKLRPKGELRALMVAANPSDLSDFGLAPVDVASELGRAQTALGGMAVTQLPRPDLKQRATLNNLVAGLGDALDILYLACHGTFVKGESILWLEDDAGKCTHIAGVEFATRLRELAQRPRLVVLASCQSAGDGAGNALAALGPCLAEAGIPAVLAMQGSISMDTVQKFMPVFFAELQKDGVVDRALAVARGAVRDQPDYWMPVLFMRLKSGRIWYVPGFADEHAGLDRWPALISSIKKGKCTPILGPGITEGLLGSTREIAQRWAETYHYPMAPSERDDLPQVAQFLAVNQSPIFPRDELGEYLRNDITAQFGGDLPAELRNGQATLDQLIEALWVKHSAQSPAEAHKVLAQLPLPIYITTSPTNLLSRALSDQHKDPQAVICPWKVTGLDSVYDQDKDYCPSPDRPLVFHLLGSLRAPDSIVLTEDDYFDYLIGVTSNKELIPGDVRAALTNTALLFLGFQMDDWAFRVFFRSIVAQQGGARRSYFAHIAVQIDPEEGHVLEPERARSYLENYFKQGFEQTAQVSIYWGNADDFLQELQHRLRDGAS